MFLASFDDRIAPLIFYQIYMIVFCKTIVSTSHKNISQDIDMSESDEDALFLIVRMCVQAVLKKLIG